MLHYLMYGLLDLSFWGYVIVTLVMTHITIASVTIFLHRAQAHRALSMHPVISHFFRFWLWLTTGIRTIEWVAIHRKHHAKCETHDDPHSPVKLGIKTVLWQGYELYRKESFSEDTMSRYGQGVPDDWLERNVYYPHSAAGILAMFFIDLLLFGIPGIIIWSVQMAWIPFFAAGVINGIGHYFGYRNFECDDAARNILPWGILIGGEELHNNHHTYGTSPKLSANWWEFDIGWMYISILKMVGLAKPRSLPPRLAPARPHLSIDAETVRAFLSARFQVLAHYRDDVVLPVLRAEREKASEAGHKLVGKVRSLVTRADHLIKHGDRPLLAGVLERCHDLRLVYQYRQKLQSIWNSTTASQRELIDALQDWCHNAEQAGVESLKKFADRIKRLAVHN